MTTSGSHPVPHAEHDMADEGFRVRSYEIRAFGLYLVQGASCNVQGLGSDVSVSRLTVCLGVSFCAASKVCADARPTVATDSNVPGFLYM